METSYEPSRSSTRSSYSTSSSSTTTSSLHTYTQTPTRVRLKGKYQLVILGYLNIVHPGISADIHFSVDNLAKRLFYLELAGEEWLKYGLKQAAPFLSTAMVL